ncbi:MAG: DUF2079 domain-containing protein [Chloroflexota bacterium]
MAIYVIAFSWLSLQRHATYNSTGLDLGIYDQAIWNTSQGRFFEASIEADNLLGDHASFLTLFYVPLYWLWPDVRVLLIAQTMVLCAGAVPIALLARRRLNNDWLVVCVVLVYLLYPALGFINRYDFHPEVLVLPVMLWGWFFIDQKRWMPTAACLALTILGKEYMGVEVAGYGVYILLSIRDSRPMKRLGLAALCIGPLWTLLMIGLVIPSFRHELPANFTERYLWFLGHNAPETARLVFLLYTKVVFLPEMLAPLLFLPLVSAFQLVPALIPLAITLLSSAPAQATIYFHYMVEFMPSLFAATVYSMEKLIHAGKESAGRASPRQLGVWLCGGMVIASLGYWLIRNPFSFSVPPIYYAVVGPQPRSNAESIAAALQLIPQDSCVIASNHLVPHLSQRRQLYLIHPLGYDRVPPAECQYLIADTREERWGDETAIVNQLIQNRTLQVIFEQDGVVVATAP